MSAVRPVRSKRGFFADIDVQETSMRRTRPDKRNSDAVASGANTAAVIKIGV